MSNKYSIIFAGTPQFAAPSLQALINDKDINIKLVITQPDRPAGRKQIITPPPVKILAERYNIPVWQPQNINKEINSLKNYKTIDYLIIVAYGQIISQSILDLPAIAALNLHASVLPRWRGASPIQSVILNGDKTTGISIQRMAPELDAGPLVASLEIPIKKDETSTSLQNKLAALGAQLLIKTIKKPLQETSQNEILATYCRKLNRTDSQADPDFMTAEEIDRKVRALNPWPGVTCTINNKTIKILESGLSRDENSYALECKNGSVLYIKKIQAPGKKPVSGKQWK